MAGRADDLAARYREIDGLMGLHWRAPEIRRWQAATADALRKALGFHPTAVEFAGLRFRAGPVNEQVSADIAGVPPQEHTARLRQDLTEAKKLLRRALTALHVDPDALPTPSEGPLAAAVAADAALPAAQRPAALEAAHRLQAALLAPAADWTPAAAALRDLLLCGPGVGKAAVAAVAARLGALR